MEFMIRRAALMPVLGLLSTPLFEPVPHHVPRMVGFPGPLLKKKMMSMSKQGLPGTTFWRSPSQKIPPWAEPCSLWLVKTPVALLKPCHAFSWLAEHGLRYPFLGLS